jgi:RimJ/RimL family protein N-acetyltransferase|tara:strand:+ start:450 stop:935 length:486 start_codon:yes stop_codon:yes gene_type:complete
MLRPFTNDHIYPLYYWYQDPENEVFFRHFDRLLTPEEFEHCCSGSYTKRLLIDSCKGFVFLTYQQKPSVCEVSVFLEKDSREEGFGIDVMKEIGRYLFVDNRIERMVLIISADDRNTNRITELGCFELEAVYKKSCFYGGRYHDENRYVMTKEKYFQEYGG